MICCICGKKQSGFIQDFSLSNEKPSYRICGNCYDEKEHLISNANRDTDAFNKSKSYFDNYLTNIEDKEVKEIIYKLLDESSQIHLEYEMKENERYCNLEKERLYREKISNYMITTGYNFEGYNITSYNGVISGEVALGTGFISDMAARISDFFGVESEKYSMKMEEAKQIAVEKLIIKSISKGDNAIIGIDFDIIIFSSNMVGISVNGTSVKVEKINS